MRLQERKLGDIAGRIRDSPGALFIGAGCSRSAGIPTAPELVELIRQRHPEDWERAVAKDYQKCMDQLDPTYQRRLIQDVVKNSQLNLTHVAIASLMKGRKINRVITTNFDSLLTRACALVGLETAVYDVDAISSAHFRALEIGDEPAIFYVHGQHFGFSQFHSPRDYTPEHGDMLRDLFRSISQTHAWLVVGYSGENDPSANALIGEDFRRGLFWVGYRDNPPCENIQNNLLIASKHAYYVPGHDADGFFAALGGTLGCDAMQAFRNPFSHLRTLFHEVSFPKESQEDKARENFIFRVHQAIQQFERGPVMPTDWRPEERLLVPDAHRGLLLTLPPFRQLRVEGFATRNSYFVNVSVPFSMGTVLHPCTRKLSMSPSSCFSPLLDGDGVASIHYYIDTIEVCLFQSPSRWGRCCIDPEPLGSHGRPAVSVPFSMGTVLHL
jgi:Sir2 family